MRIYQVDAFTSEVFRGNPAAVVPLNEWLEDSVLQSIASENNLSETAFFVAVGDRYQLRWFAPMGEVPLCGHATLATAHILFTELGYSGDIIRFETVSGSLFVRRRAARLELDFPRVDLVAVTDPMPVIENGLGVEPQFIYESRRDPNYYAVLESEATVRALRPCLEVIATLHPRGLAATAPGDETDFVSRYFLPSFGIDEDPVTGSIHCALAPLWGERLGKQRLRARQVSARGGSLDCTIVEDRVRIAGSAVTYLAGELRTPERWPRRTRS